jgi:hypothetical protein
MRHLRGVTRQNPNRAQFTDAISILNTLVSLLSLIARIFEIAGITPPQKLR